MEEGRGGRQGEVSSLTCFSSDGCQSYCYHSSWVRDKISYSERGGRERWGGKERLTCLSSDRCQSYGYHSSWVRDEVSYRNLL